MTTPTRIKVWDPLVRVFHWGLVVAFFIAYLTEDELLTVHIYAGYTVLGLVLFRIIWGFIGTPYARFNSFVTSPRRAWHYLKDTLGRHAKHYLGHNPAGGAMIILLIISLIITTLTGIVVYGAVESAGPMGAWLGNSGEFWEDLLEEVHEFFANFTVALVIIHVLGVIVESRIHRENLVKAMVTGYKSTDDKSAIH